MKQFEQSSGITDVKIDTELQADLKRQINKGEAKVNETKGGFRITEYLTYNWFVFILIEDLF